MSGNNFVEWVLAFHLYSRYQRLNSGCQFCVQALLLAEPSHWPTLAIFLEMKWIMPLKYIQHLKISSMTSVFIRLKLKCGFIRGASVPPSHVSPRVLTLLQYCVLWDLVLELWPGWQGNEERTVTLRKIRQTHGQEKLGQVSCMLPGATPTAIAWILSTGWGGLRRQFARENCGC